MASFDSGFKDIKTTLTDLLNRFAGWILLFAIIWLCWGIARIVWLILAPPTVPNLPLAERKNRPALQVNAGNALNVFAVNEPKVNTPPPAPPPNVTLTGVMIAEPSEYSSAMLDVDGTIANYRIGETLKGSDYRVIEVAWEQVILADANDQQIVLDMPERMSLNQPFNADANETSNARGISNRRLPTGNNSNPTRDAIVSNNRLDDALTNANDEADNNALQDNGDTGQNEPSAESAIDNAVNELKENPASYLSQMGVMATGEGYQVTDAMPSKIRNRLGLESGDRVLTVNGQNVGSNPAGDADLLGQVKQSGEAVIEVQRGEQTITIRQQF